MHLFQNKMKEQINQSIVHRWLGLFPISQAIFEFYLEKMSRLLRRSIFWKRTELICTPNNSFSVQSTTTLKFDYDLAFVPGTFCLHERFLRNLGLAIFGSLRYTRGFLLGKAQGRSIRKRDRVSRCKGKSLECIRETWEAMVWYMSLWSPSGSLEALRWSFQRLQCVYVWGQTLDTGYLWIPSDRWSARVTSSPSLFRLVSPMDFSNFAIHLSQSTLMLSRYLNLQQAVRYDVKASRIQKHNQIKKL